MIMGWFGRERASRNIEDLEVGDLVANRISGVKGAVMQVTEGLVTVDYLDGIQDVLPAAAFRRLEAGGSHFDARKP